MRRNTTRPARRPGSSNPSSQLYDAMGSLRRQRGMRNALSGAMASRPNRTQGSRPTARPGRGSRPGPSARPRRRR